MNGLRAAAFLDRDGTINVEKDYLYRITDFEYMDGAVEGLRRLQAMGFLPVVVTNQSGIARGYYAEEDFHRLTDWMISDMEEKGIHIERVYYCPHHPEGMIKRYAKNCHCRKPKTGLFYQAARELGIDFKQSIAIGDKPRDLEICKETEVKGILLSEEPKKSENFICCKDWKEVISSVEKFQFSIAL